jgi:tRNA(fMet)-specific endonuclease VapC
VTAPHLYLLDTNIISHIMRDPMGHVAQRVFAHEAQEAQGELRTICTSLIVQCELQFGLSKLPNPKWERQYHRAMASMTVENLGPEVVMHYAHIRSTLEAKGQPIGPNDTLIAAHALALGATLVTADTEFTRVPGLKLENWLQALP